MKALLGALKDFISFLIFRELENTELTLFIDNQVLIDAIKCKKLRTSHKRWASLETKWKFREIPSDNHWKYVRGAGLHLNSFITFSGNKHRLILTFTKIINNIESLTNKFATGSFS